VVVTGIYYALGLVAGGIVVSWLTRPVWGIPLFVLALFCLYFFRDPDRQVPAGPVAVSPADGKVIDIRKENGGTRLSIFLSVFDVHVNRTPISGKITSVEYKPGRFLVASRDEASMANEQNTITVEGDGTRVVFKQIAGLVARRIIFYKRKGDSVRMGDRVGLIQFGSRMDVHFGPEWGIEVRLGDRVQAGASVLARRTDR